MIRARESADSWAQYAHHLLDRARDGGRGRPVSESNITWALAYLGDTKDCTKIPDSLFPGRQRWSANRQAVPA
jgi:hypothetical protein